MKNPESFIKGEEFEKFIEENLFSEKNYTLIHRTNNYEQNKDRYSENTLFPDFKFRCKKTNQEFYIEAKFRSKFNKNNQIEIMSLAQKERFLKIELTEKTPVFIIVGYFGSSSSPDKLSLIPLKNITFLKVYSSFLKKHNIEKENIIFEKLNFEKNEQEENNTYVKPKRNKRNILIYTLLTSVILFFTLIFMIPEPPNPKLINTRAKNEFRELFEYSTKITGRVINNGGDGNILIKAILTQDDNIYNKTKTIYLEANETEEFQFIFNETKYLDKTPSYKVKVMSLSEK